MTNDTDTMHLITTDKNTLRPIIWNVEDVRPAGDAVTAQNGWTHQLMVCRPKGRRVYIVWAIMADGLIVRNSEPLKLW